MKFSNDPHEVAIAEFSLAKESEGYVTVK